MKGTDSVHPLYAEWNTEGLSIRDYIAIEAMKAFIPIVNEASTESINMRAVASHSFAMADAMIAYSNKEKE